MDALSKLKFVRKMILKTLFDLIEEVHLSEEHFTLKIIIKKGLNVYLRYNDYEEYSYQFVFSDQIDDFIRYDNFDDRWPVKTRPHHLHFKPKEVIDSKMNGNPHHDVDFLIEEIKKWNKML